MDVPTCQSSPLPHRAARGWHLWLRAAALLLASHCAAALAGSGTASAAAAELGDVHSRPQAPAFELPDLDGRLHRLADYRGRVLLVNFWATWCPPCRAEMPSLQRVWRLLHEAGLALVAIDFGEPAEQVSAYAMEDSIEFPLLIDEHGSETRRWPMRGLPTTFLIDRRGRIALRHQGGREWDDPEAVELLRRLLAEPVPPAG